MGHGLLHHYNVSLQTRFVNNSIQIATNQVSIAISKREIFDRMFSTTVAHTHAKLYM